MMYKSEGLTDFKASFLYEHFYLYNILQLEESFSKI